MIVTLAIFGGALIFFTMEFLSQVIRPDRPPSEAMGHQIGILLLVVTMLAAMPAVGMGAYVMYIGSRIRLTRQWPPAGMGFQAVAPVMLGDRAAFISAMVMGLGGVLVVCGLVLPIFAWQFGTLFLE